MGNARNVIKKRTRCFICEKWMEVGEPFVFLELRSRGVDRWLPAHTEHKYPLKGVTEELDRLKAQAEHNGHGEEPEYGHTAKGYADESDFYVI